MIAIIHKEYIEIFPMPKKSTPNGLVLQYSSEDEYTTAIAKTDVVKGKNKYYYLKQEKRFPINAWITE